MLPVYELLVANKGELLSGNQVAKHFSDQGKSKAVALRALKELVAQGVVGASEPQGGRGTVHHHVLRPYPGPAIVSVRGPEATLAVSSSQPCLAELF